MPLRTRLSTWTYFELILGELLGNQSGVAVSQARHGLCSVVQADYKRLQDRGRITGFDSSR